MARSLHLLCAPYPTPQGTQGWVAAALNALASHGHDPHLLSYRSGAATRAGSFTHHRQRSEGSVSFRSGPSWEKVWLDLRMIPELRRQVQAHRPDVLVAHNIEAACVARAAGFRRYIFVAHTRFDTELPTYASGGRAPLRLAGAGLDRIASAGVRVGAVSPSLAAHFSGVYLPPAWSTPAPVSSEERRAAREAMALDGRAVLYAGNLDGYQGWERVVHALVGTGATLLLATESSAAPALALGAQLGVPVRVARLGDERDRRVAHAAADLAAIPREAEGGLPIKLIDAMSRGLPIAAEHAACAGLTPDGVWLGALGESIHGFAQATREERVRRASASRAWVAQHCSPGAFVDAFESLTRGGNTAHAAAASRTVAP